MIALPVAATNPSPPFISVKTVVQEYAKAKKEIQHSRQTLSILLANYNPACRSNRP